MIRPVALAILAALAAVMPAGATDANLGQEDAVTLWEADRAIVFDASEVDLDDFRWLARPIVVFADTPRDPAFRRQMELLSDRPAELAERDVVVVVDTDPSARSELRRKLRPRGFQITLIGKDGGVKLRKPFPWDVRELSRQIDKMPIRQQELRDERRGAASGADG